MRALRIDDSLHLAVDEPEPTPAPDEALIKLRLAGICHTDLEITRGYKGFHGILGHEFVGKLVNDAGDFRAGQRVVGEINVGCGKCEFCRAGITSQCLDRHALGITGYPGAFADYLRLPVHNLHAVPESISDEQAVFTEPLAAALQVMQSAPVLPSYRVALIGAGKLGLLIAQVLKLTGCDLTVIARHDKALNLLQKWGIKSVDTRTHEWKSVIPPRSAHMVVDCTGNAEGFATALDMLRPRGTLVLKSTYAGLPQADLSRIVVDELRVIGSRCGPFPAALRLLEQNLVDVTGMIEATYPLGQAVEAFNYAAGHGILKVLLQPN